MKACKSLNQSKFELLSHYYKITLKIIIDTYIHLLDIRHDYWQEKNLRSFAVSIPFDTLWETLVLDVFFSKYRYGCTDVYSGVAQEHLRVDAIPEPPWSTGNQTLDLSLGIPCPTHSTTATPYDYIDKK